MNNESAFPAFPVNGWQVGAVEDLNGVVIRLVTVLPLMRRAVQRSSRSFLV